MTDAVGSMVENVAGNSYLALPLALIAGAVTSIGPCMAPRYLALVAILHGPKRSAAVAAFACGLVLTYVIIGSSAALIDRLIGARSTLDAVLAAGLILYGVCTLAREPHRCAEQAGARHSAAFTVGSASALIVSPCCTPVIAAIAGLGTFDRDPRLAVAALALFALGHAAPMFALGAAGERVARGFRSWAASSAAVTVAGTLAVALGCYYGLLA